MTSAPSARNRSLRRPACAPRAGHDDAGPGQCPLPEPGESLRSCCDITDNDYRGSGYLLLGRLLGDRVKRAVDRALVGKGPALDHSGGLVRAAPGFDQRGRVRAEAAHPHVEDQCPGEPGVGLPVGDLVPTHECNRAGIIPMGDRDSRVGRSGSSGSHAWNYLERDSGVKQRLGLLAPAPEHEWIAALQPHGLLPGSCGLDELLRDLLLSGRPVPVGFDPRPLADVDELGVRARAVQSGRRDQSVVEDDVGPGNQLRGPHRHEPRIAGARADQVDPSANVHLPPRSCGMEYFSRAGRLQPEADVPSQFFRPIDGPRCRVPDPLGPVRAPDVGVELKALTTRAAACRDRRVAVGLQGPDNFPLGENFRKSRWIAD